MVNIDAEVGFARPDNQDGGFDHNMPSRERCSSECLGTVLEVITTVLVLAGYSVFLIWLLAYLKGNLYYYLLNLISFTLILMPLLLCCVRKEREVFNPIQTGGEGGGRLTPPRFKSFITHERLRLQCSYFVTLPQIYLGTIWCC